MCGRVRVSFPEGTGACGLVLFYSQSHPWQPWRSLVKHKDCLNWHSCLEALGQDSLDCCDHTSILQQPLPGNPVGRYCVQANCSKLFQKLVSGRSMFHGYCYIGRCYITPFRFRYRDFFFFFLSLGSSIGIKKQTTHDLKSDDFEIAFLELSGNETFPQKLKFI